MTKYTEVKKPAKMGRPSSYDPKYCDVVIEAGKRGDSVVGMAVAVGCLRETLYDWANAHEEFATALKEARLHSQIWWENAAKEGMRLQQGGGSFNAKVWEISVKSRFREDYLETSKVELTGANGGAIKTESTVTLDPSEAYKLLMAGK